MCTSKKVCTPGSRKHTLSWRRPFDGTAAGVGIVQSGLGASVRPLVVLAEYSLGITHAAEPERLMKVTSTVTSVGSAALRLTCVIVSRLPAYATLHPESKKQDRKS